MTVSSPPSNLPRVSYVPPADTGLNVLYQDDFLLVVDKPEGLLSVPGRGDDRQDCLVSRVQREVPDALIVHRLDMATSGLLVLARGEQVHRQLSRQFQDREVDKCYVAVVCGLLTQEAGEVNLPLITDWPNRPLQMVCHERGKPSLTRYRVLARDLERGETRVALEPVTGRSHQLRVHMLALGHPIAGDPFYGDADSQGRAPRLLLHAAELSLRHPVTGQALRLHSPAPF
ncbi:MAG TPA: RluA family pseudouridine synthase [Aquabacterium sp.]|nr:RluA family pseudouridine synthase [Aquabacterium sp.]